MFSSRPLQSCDESFAEVCGSPPTLSLRMQVRVQGPRWTGPRSLPWTHFPLIMTCTSSSTPGRPTCVVRYPCLVTCPVIDSPRVSVLHGGGQPAVHAHFVGFIESRLRKLAGAFRIHTSTTSRGDCPNISHHRPSGHRGNHVTFSPTFAVHTSPHPTGSKEITIVVTELLESSSAALSLIHPYPGAIEWTATAAPIDDQDATAPSEHFLAKATAAELKDMLGGVLPNLEEPAATTTPASSTTTATAATAPAVPTSSDGWEASAPAGDGVQPPPPAEETSSDEAEQALSRVLETGEASGAFVEAENEISPPEDEPTPSNTQGVCTYMVGLRADRTRTRGGVLHVPGWIVQTWMRGVCLSKYTRVTDSSCLGLRAEVVPWVALPRRVFEDRLGASLAGTSDRDAALRTTAQELRRRAREELRVQEAEVQAARAATTWTATTSADPTKESTTIPTAESETDKRAAELIGLGPELPAGVLTVDGSRSRVTATAHSLVVVDKSPEPVSGVDSSELPGLGPDPSSSLAPVLRAEKRPREADPAPEAASSSSSSSLVAAAAASSSSSDVSIPDAKRPAPAASTEHVHDFSMPVSSTQFGRLPPAAPSSIGQRAPVPVAPAPVPPRIPPRARSRPASTGAKQLIL